jgi:hypothetical protein
MSETNCCVRCGQSLDLIDDAWADDKGIKWNNSGEYCPRCYMDIVEMKCQ